MQQSITQDTSVIVIILLLLGVILLFIYIAILVFIIRIILVKILETLEVNYISSLVNNMLTYIFVLFSNTFSYPYDRHYLKDPYFFQAENIFRRTVIIFQTMFLRKSLFKNDFIKYDEIDLF